MNNSRLCGSSFAFSVCRFKGSIDDTGTHHCGATTKIHSSCVYRCQSKGESDRLKNAVMITPGKPR